MSRILLVDDDHLLRGFLATVLTEAGHSVLPAVDGRQAMDLLHVSAVDLIVTDIVMPELEGVELILTLSRERPSLPIIAMSGDPRHSKLFLEMAAKLGARRVLSKPFGPAALLAAISDALCNAPPADSELPSRDKPRHPPQ